MLTHSIHQLANCVLVCQTFPPLIGGSAVVYDSLARHAGGAIAVLTSRLDHVTRRERQGWREHDRDAPYRVQRIGLVRPPLRQAAPRSGVLRRAAWAVGTARLAVAVVEAVLRHRADAVCVCDDETVGWLVPFVRYALRRRALVYCHGDDLVERNPAARRARRRWFDAAHVVVAAGRFAETQLVDVYGVGRDRVAVLPNGVDLERFRPLSPDPILQAGFRLEGRRVLLAPSRLVPRKGVDRLIQALPAIRARRPEALLLVVGDGPQRGELEALAAAAGGSAAVRFAGAVPAAEMPALYALAELVVLPNRAEPGESDGTPLVFLEANACGRPVIGGLAGGTPEVVEPGRNGLLVDGTDPAAIASAVLQILEDPSLAMRLAQGARDVALASGWQARAMTFLALCRGG